MSNSPLGRLEQVDLRTVWTSEAAGFTPWLAQPENLDVLGETLGLSLEIESVEKAVGSFRADIVCRVAGEEGSLVLIENQLERTDHDHLGKLLTYSAGLQAITAVWLAGHFRDEHRAALDWLNANTPDRFRFFGLEIELWKIGDSCVAPKFNIVSMPNDWSRSVSPANSGVKSEAKLRHLEYWAGLHSALDAQNGQVKGNRKPQPHSWMSYTIGRTEFHLYVEKNSRERFIRVSLYLTGEKAGERHDLLEQKKDEIEHELGYSLEWSDQSPTAKERRIAYYRRHVDPDDELDWSVQHEWLATHLNQLHRVFVQRVRDV
ncbi:MAG: DUF4268 domain-containing protein [Gammaproteobacteria bacterium]|nr:DUF4268 domain-containing protein [Gammaproteobacteria bacterium]MYE53099.1 DUF4268 domain-containing protein [Gammaproteobacteria bacterium]MYF50241.1 DUF4268 domain-containing protein [Gammaproteobacteria bacterium]